MTPLKGWEILLALTLYFSMPDFDIKETLRMTLYVGGIIVTFGSIILFLIGWKNRWLERFKPLTTVANTATLFLKEILPGILEKFEKRGLAPEGTLSKWTTLVSPSMVETRSPRTLTEVGKNLLEESGIKKYIDDNLSTLIQDLEDLKLNTSFDVEERSFYIFKDIGESEAGVPLKKYLYNNPNKNMDTIILVGSIYLRDEYLKVHTELLEDSEEAEPQAEENS